MIKKSVPLCVPFCINTVEDLVENFCLSIILDYMCGVFFFLSCNDVTMVFAYRRL